MAIRPQSIKGRGAPDNPGNRFESRVHVPDPDAPGPQAADDPEYSPKAPRRHPLTQFLVDHSRSIIATNDSPDVPFTASINPYRGCEHGCVYCFARPTHEYLGMSAGLDFETKILVKHEAPELLRRELASPRWMPQVINCSGVTDCYQPIERKLRITRRCLGVLLDFRNPVCIVTKNHLVTRDLDVLKELAKFECVKVFISLTTLDPHLTRILEPRTSDPAQRLEAIRILRGAGIPTGMLMAPVIPGLTDHEMPQILATAKEAGALSAGFVPLRLPFVVKDLFVNWLATHFPDRQKKVVNLIRGMKGGKLNDPNWSSRMRGDGPWAEQFGQLFHITCERLGFNKSSEGLSTAHFRRPVMKGEQLGLFMDYDHPIS